MSPGGGPPPPAALYGEAVDSQGQPRSHWAHLLGAVADLGGEELRRRGAEAARLLDADGVVLNVAAAAGEQRPRRRPWKLDPLPTLVSSLEWAEVEAGVRERAELLSLILEDVYGERTLLRSGLIPPEVVFGHPGFLRPCAGTGARPGRSEAGRRLFSYAADLARNPSGQMVVLADRADAPAGAGYALENRQVIAKVLPALYREAQVQRLAPFFRTLRLGLQRAAPPGVEDPRIVVLTPGPLNETAFEHALLAATLGYPLVQGRDLTVRDGRVWMRSVGRLEPVDVILRRVDSPYCDPLELRGDSQLGVPGLLEAARLERVSVLNPVGSGVLEHPALMAFIDRVAVHLLGHPPRLSSLRTWWCGEPRSEAYVLDHLDELVLRGVRGGLSRLGRELTGAERDQLRRIIRHRPADWVGQEALDFSTVPVLDGTELASARTWTRVFATAAQDGYAVMPGGLGRVGQVPGSTSLTAADDAAAKDTWVLASEPEPVSAFWLQPGPAVVGLDPMTSIPAGAAESLWWLGRYAERAEALTRLLRARGDRVSEFGGSLSPAGEICLEALDAALERTGGGHPGETLAGALRATLDNAGAVRDQLSRDTWLVLAPLERLLSRPGGLCAGAPAPAPAVLTQVLTGLLALTGLGVESMVRDVGWRFMDAGRRLERSLQLVFLLGATVPRARGTAADSLLLESVLGAAESIITYRYRYRSQAQLETVLDLLVLDQGNPRSLAHSLRRLSANLDALPAPQGGRRSGAQRRVLELTTTLALTQPDELVAVDGAGGRPALAELLTQLGDLLLSAGDAVDEEHFRRPEPSFSQLAPTGHSGAHGFDTEPEPR